jgi:uncharacterized protein YfaS (alpha-2-macroglobulin family)
MLLVAGMVVLMAGPGQQRQQQQEAQALYQQQQQCVTAASAVVHGGAALCHLAAEVPRAAATAGRLVCMLLRWQHQQLLLVQAMLPHVQLLQLLLQLRWRRSLQTWIALILQWVLARVALWQLLLQAPSSLSSNSTCSPSSLSSTVEQLIISMYRQSVSSSSSVCSLSVSS